MNAHEHAMRSALMLMALDKPEVLSFIIEHPDASISREGWSKRIVITSYDNHYKYPEYEEIIEQDNCYCSSSEVTMFVELYDKQIPLIDGWEVQLRVTRVESVPYPNEVKRLLQDIGKMVLNEPEKPRMVLAC